MTPLAGSLSLLATALAVLRQRMPRLDVTVRLTSRSSVTTGVARGDFDVGLLDGLAAPGDLLPLLTPLSGAGIAESEIALVLPNGHPLAGRAGIRLADLVDARWIDAPNVAPPLSDIRRVTGTDGFRPAFSYDGTDTLSLIALAAAGHGLTLLPTSLASVGEVVSVRVGEPRIVHRVELVQGTLHDGSPAAKLASLL